jgi:uncharacterized protein YwqG
VTSQLGGEPHLPTEFLWPRVDDSPMAFLGQFRLDEISGTIPTEVLPTSGLLSIFALIEADGGYPMHEDNVLVRIFSTEDLRRAWFPEDLDEQLRYGRAGVLIRPFVSLPPLYEVIREIDEEFDEEFDPEFDEDAVSDLLDELEPEGTDNRLFGFPGSLQGYGAAEGWRLLFQIDADPIMDTSFGDGGRLHLWIPSGIPFEAAIGQCTISMDSG